MTAPGSPLVAPSPPGGADPLPPDPDDAASPGDPVQVLPWHRRHPGRVRLVAFALSVAVHLVALLLYPEITVRFGDLDPTADTRGPVTVDGIEVVNLQEVEADETETPVDPEAGPATPDVALPGLPRIPLSGDELVPVRPTRPGDGITAADRLRPATREEGLWIPLVPDAVTLTDQEVLQSLIYGQLEAFNDSMAIRAAQAARGTDWTYTDDEGNRWGISPGRLHLGRISIPLPFSFGSPTGASDDALDALSIDREIRRAAGQLEADATVEERAAAIRARIDAERARRAAPPDTSRGGGGESP